MRDHFEWVWEHASIPIGNVLEAKSIGTDKGFHQSGIVNVFASVGEGRNRIQWLLDHAQGTVWIQECHYGRSSSPARCSIRS